MEKLTNKEEEIMCILWKIEKGFVNDIAEHMPEPKPHYNTLSTLIRILVEKGVVSYKTYGKSHQYYPILKKEDYRKKFMDETIEKYFDNSLSNLVTFFVEEKKINSAEIDELLAIIEKNRK